ncbi:MAG: hypothetical protein ABSB74_10660 [Tepidisphaeraceae bacterium]
MFEARQHQIIPDDTQLREWLVGAFEQPLFAKLIAGLVRYPCMYCEKGSESCKGCNGGGMDDRGSVCRQCSGFGVVRCDFCDGTGLATYNMIPENLRPEVLRGRIVLATTQLNRLIAERLPPTTSQRQPQQRLANRILSLNKLLGVLENARVEANRLSENPTHRSEIAGSIQQIDSNAQAAKSAVLKAIAALAARAREQSRSDSSPALREVASTRADFYEQLAKAGTLGGTALQHPFLLFDRGNTDASTESAQDTAEEVPQ